MEDAIPTTSDDKPHKENGPDWTYPTRFCRICREDVAPTVTMYPPGIPMQYQTPIVEYRNDDEYGRLIRPCNCRGTQRYIHELCLLRSRTENPRAGSMWKCHECGYQFDFKKLTVQRILSSRISVAVLTIFFMVFIVFVLGFIADPIINIYLDPYDSLTGKESLWEELEVRSAKESRVSAWSQHFAKGFISMGLVGFVKTVLLNPFHYMNLRWSGTFSSGGRSNTGRDRAVNISWIAIIIGICSAFAFFYRFMSAIIQRWLQRIGNNIVDTQLPGDDDDLKPPAGWKHKPAKDVPTEGHTSTTTATDVQSEVPTSDDVPVMPQMDQQKAATEISTERSNESSKSDEIPLISSEMNDTPLMGGSWIDVKASTTPDLNDEVPQIHRQGWSFANL